MNTKIVKDKKNQLKEEYGSINLEGLTEKANRELKTRPDKAKAMLQKRNEGKASEETVKKVLSTIFERISYKGGDDADTLIAIVVILQKGGTSPRQPGNTEITYGNSTVTLQMVRDSCKEQKITVRQLARGMISIITVVMLNLGNDAPEGNLAKKYRTEYPDAGLEETVWASDFQTYNPECPERVRMWLIKDHKEKFA